MFESLRDQQEQFIRNFIKSEALNSVMLEFRSLAQENISIENRDASLEEIEANKAKSIVLAKQLLALYDKADLDEQTRREFDALDKISKLPKSLLDIMRSAAYPAATSSE